MLRSVGTRMGEGWLGHLQKSESIIRVLQVFRCENMNGPIHKNWGTHDVRANVMMFPRFKISNVVTFQNVRPPTSRR